MRMAINRSQGYDWQMSNRFAREEFTGLVTGREISFRMIREAGTIEFTGKFNGQSGSGQFVFRANPEYQVFLKNKGYTHVSMSKLFSLALFRVNRKYINGIFELGYQDISLSKLIAFAVHVVSTDFIKSIHKLGYKDISASKLISFKVHGIGRDFIEKIQKQRGKDITPNKIISYKIHCCD